MPRILIADVPQGLHRAQKSLGRHYHLICVSTIQEAEKVLSVRKFDMVICGVQFDNSRMFDLLQYIRSVDHLDDMPFLVLNNGSVPFSKNASHSAKLLGAAVLVETGNKPEEVANELLRAAVRQNFDRPVKHQRADRRL